MIHILTISVFVSLLVFAPSTAAAQVVYSYCNIERLEGYGVIVGSLSLDPDYATAANYTILADFSIVSMNGQTLAAADQVVFGQYSWTATTIPIEAEEDLYGLGTTTIISYFYNWYYDPMYCSIYPWYCDPYNAYMNFYDIYGYTNAQGSSGCNSFRMSTCFATGIPLFLAVFPLAEQGHQYDILPPKIIKPIGNINGPNPNGSFISFDINSPNNPSWYFDFQAVTSSTLGWYPLNIEGVLNPSSTLTAQWSTDPVAGTIANSTATATTYSPPNYVPTNGQTTLTLEAISGGASTGKTASKVIKIYQDHMARDYDIFGIDNSCDSGWSFTKFNVTITVPNRWNCHGSLQHAHEGKGSGYTNFIFFDDWGMHSYSYYPADPSFSWQDLENSLNRGDIVAFFASQQRGGQLEHSHTALGASDHKMYGANNQPQFNPVTT